MNHMRYSSHRCRSGYAAAGVLPGSTPVSARAQLLLLPHLGAVPRSVETSCNGGDGVRAAHVCHDHGGYAEIITYGRNGFLLGTQAEAFEILLRLKEDRRTLRELVGREDRRTAEG